MALYSSYEYPPSGSRVGGADLPWSTYIFGPPIEEVILLPHYAVAATMDALDGPHTFVTIYIPPRAHFSWLQKFQQSIVNQKWAGTLWIGVDFNFPSAQKGFA